MYPTPAIPLPQLESAPNATRTQRSLVTADIDSRHFSQCALKSSSLLSSLLSHAPSEVL